MILGMSLAAFTQFHVVISLIGIVAGIVVLVAMLGAQRLPTMTFLFLLTSVITDITGFMFPMPFDAADVVGIISLVFLGAALLALYARRLAGVWRAVYVIGATAGLYLNCFVLVVQTFQKVPFFHQLAPKGNEPAFAAAQGVVLVLFIGLGIAALRRFRPLTRTRAVA